VSEIALPNEASDLLVAYEAHKAGEKSAAKSAADVQRQLIALLGEHTDGLLLDGRRITYRPQSRKSIDSAALRAKFPEAAAACEKESTFPVFRVLKK
jgi:hypothetical protein